MRRPPQNHWRFLLNTSSDHLEIHDLDNEQTGANECQINEIIQANNAQYLKIDTTLSSVELWKNNNPEYDGCKYCLPHLHHK